MAENYLEPPPQILGFPRVNSPDDIFSILGSLETLPSDNFSIPEPHNVNLFTGDSTRLASQRELQDLETESRVRSKRPKLTAASAKTAMEAINEDELQKMSHITVERNRRKQMNHHLTVLRSLMPSFYVKRADQASIIGGVVEYINELQQVLHSLEAKKQRKFYSEVVLNSPRVLHIPISPKLPPIISPKTPNPPSSPYPLPPNSAYLSPPLCSPKGNTVDAINELVASSVSEKAEVEVKFTGANVVLKTASGRKKGQILKVVSELEDLCLQILKLEVSTVDESTVVNSITIKIGIECQLSAEELAHRVLQTFC